MKFTASLGLSFLLGLLLQLPMNAVLPAMAASKVKPLPVATPVAMMTMAPVADTGVQALEDTLYTTHYDSEPVESRLNRLEITVFGQPSQSNLPVNARVSRLKAVLSQPNEIAPLAPNTSTATTAPAQPQTSSRTTQPQQQTSSSYSKPSAQTQPEPGETDYPIVSEMENKLFSKTFDREDITQRLSRLEKEVFKVQQSGVLADRVDHLRSVVLGDDNNNALTPDRTANAPYSPPPIQWNPPASSGYGNSSGSFTYYNNSNNSSSYNTNGGSQRSNNAYSMQMPSTYGNRGGSLNDQSATPDMLSAMAEVEKQVIGHTYPSEPMNVRLDRLETKVFNTTSPEMPNEERMQRVIAVASAGGAPQSAQSRTRSAFQTLLPIILTILPMVLL